MGESPRVGSFFQCFCVTRGHLKKVGSSKNRRVAFLDLSFFMVPIFFCRGTDSTCGYSVDIERTPDFDSNWGVMSGKFFCYITPRPPFLAQQVLRELDFPVVTLQAAAPTNARGGIHPVPQSVKATGRNRRDVGDAGAAG
jgi:hypothetical protein